MAEIATYEIERVDRKVLEREYEKKRTETRELKTIIENLYRVLVRSLVLIKYAVRVLAIAATYRWLGKELALMLAGFVVLTGLLQLAIDKARKAVNPKLRLSEWDVTFDVLES